jgi:hypothetical protein
MNYRWGNHKKTFQQEFHEGYGWGQRPTANGAISPSDSPELLAIIQPEGKA